MIVISFLLASILTSILHLRMFIIGYKKGKRNEVIG